MGSESDSVYSSRNLLCSSESEYDEDNEEDYTINTVERLPQRIKDPPTVLYWVRTSALRNHDNEAFSNAISDPDLRFRAVFIIDPWYTCVEGKKKKGLNRLRFLLESLHDINHQLWKYGTSLYILKGHPLTSMEKVCEEWNVKKVVFQADRELRSDIVEESMENLLCSMNIKYLKFQGHTLYNSEHITKKITCMKDFRELLPLLGPPGLPCDTPEPPVLINEHKKEEVPDEYSIPALSDFGYSSSETLYSNKTWIGGETEAFRRLNHYFKVRKEARKTLIQDLCNSSSLSPYIRFGCISVRYFLWKTKEMVNSDPSYGFLWKEVVSKLMQREFYFTASAQVPNFDQYNNPFCLQLPWERDEFLFNRWKEGQTGYPWIDAAMRQLKQEGWIHHCLRESVATFLTRGDLWQSWEKGKDIFKELLLDFEPCVSCGCWMKSSCSAFITGPVEHYCPITFGKKMDPDGIFIRHYVPELQHYPSEYIFCPWMAPLSVQTEAGCQVGVEYPHPIIDHRTAGVLCCERLRSIMIMYQQAGSNKHHPSTP